jgi:long-chain fatty acid transport protein
MRKIGFLTFMVAAFVPSMLFAGGIVTNTNQSASFIRMPAQDATISIEGTYYNPAGLVHLENGFYVSLSSQTISQSREISSTFSMNRQEFVGDVFAPVFPTFYAVYKMDKVAYSLGVNPIGGGGSANFKEGLPSFETLVKSQNIPALLTASGIPTTAYRLDASLNGSSLNWGIQFNASYALNDVVSVSLGFRYIIANNSYDGGMNIFINPNQPAFNQGGRVYNGEMVSAPQFFTDASTTFAGWAIGATSYYAGLQPIIDGGGGSTSLSNGASVGLTATQIAQIQGLLTAAGLTPTQIGAIDIATAQATLGAAAPVFTSSSSTMAYYAGLTSDKELDAKQSGSGISPIVGLNLKFSDALNVALKYEHKADITMTNKTVKDVLGMYPDGAKSPSDMPSLLSVGIGYRPLEKLYVTGGFHYYFDKNANYGKKIGGSFVANEEVLDGNSLEAAFGLEYKLTDKLLLSAGYLLTQTGANDKYHSDLSHSLNTNSFGGGGKYQINEKMALNLGFMYTMYQSYTKDFTAYKETYNRKAMVGAIGIDYKF